MFTPARYIIIDDEPSQLAPLVNALHAIGTPCIGVHFQPPKLPEPGLFSGVRVLFTDLHLVAAATSDDQHFNTILSLLDRCVPDQHGPYILVLWTSHEQKRDALTARLMERLDAAKRPLAVLALDKNNFRNGDSFDRAIELQAAVADRIASNPQLKALLSWEQDVLSAANATLATVGALVPVEKRTVADYPAALDRILSQIAVAAAGEDGSRADTQGAIYSALSPILNDRVLNHTTDADRRALWTSAATFGGMQPPLTVEQRARMNRALHLAFPDKEAIGRQDWGVVFPLTGDHVSDPSMMAKFGMTRKAILESEFRIKPENIDSVSLILVRMGAACDQAQANQGPVPFVLGILKPHDQKISGTPSAAHKQCREVLDIPGNAAPVNLCIHARFSITMTPAELGSLPEPLMRLREQLLMTILFHSSTHVMRPGTLSF